LEENMEKDINENMEKDINESINEDVKVSNFIQDIIEQDLESGKVKKIHTRFPPEPNGYLHIGHAKAICINFGMAEKYNGLCNLRFDDTNPSKEDIEYVESIMEDVRWLGFDWEDRLYFASDYYQQFYEYAIVLIKKGLAYVDDLSADEIREYRGTLTEPGKESPWRNRSVEENLDLFERMKNGFIAHSGKPKDVLTYEIIEEVYKIVCLVYENPVSKKPHIVPVRSL
jgi:glutaminyl-tRNA synthetase